MVDLDHKKYVKTKNLGFTKMKKRSQKLIFKYDYLTSLQSVQINGERRYLYGDEKLPSVTTVLGKTKDQTFLDEWKKRIGELERLRMNDPQALARQIEEQFGFEYVE